MAIQPDLVGTVTLTGGSTAFTWVGTSLVSAAIRPGDEIRLPGKALVLTIATVDSATTGTLTDDCPAAAAGSAQPARVRYQSDLSRVAAQTRQLIELLGGRGFFRYDAVGTLAERDEYDSRPRGFAFLDVSADPAKLYVKASDDSGDWSPPLSYATGPTGPTGPAANMDVGSTTTGAAGTNANVTIEGTAPNYTLNFTIPRGNQGIQGVQGPAGFRVDAVGEFADRDTYDDEEAGFSFVATDGDGDTITEPVVFVKMSATSGDWSAAVAFGASGVGAMEASTYDPDSVASNAFDSANHSFNPSQSWVTAVNTQGAIKEITGRLRVGRRFEVDGEKILRDPDGQRFIVRGMQMFSYVFVSHEYREDYRYRTFYTDGAGYSTNFQGYVTLHDSTTVTSGAGTGVSEPKDGGLRIYWRNEAFMNAQLDRAAAIGLNTIQVGVEPAMQFSPPFIDPVDGLPYPSEMQVLDMIIDGATRRGMVVELRQSNDQVSHAHAATFMAWLAQRYADRVNVWLNPANEINCFGVRQPDGSLTPNANCTVPSVWISDIETLVSAIRAAGWLNPIVINTTGWSGTVATVLSQMTASTVVMNDPNLIVGVHHYRSDSNDDFVTDRWGSRETEWAPALAGRFCLIMEEIGAFNTGQRYDPSNLPTAGDWETQWPKTQAYYRQFFWWCAAASADARIHGVIGFNFGAYHTGTTRHDNNSMIFVNDSFGWTGWGLLFRDNFLRRVIEPLGPGQCRLIRSGTNAISLVAHNGNKVPVDGRMRTLPKDGLSLDVSAIAADTLHYVYLRQDMTMEASTTAFRIDWFRDIPVKTGNPAHTLVGMVYRDSTLGVVDQEDARFVRSWFNRSPSRLSDNFTVDRASTSGSLALIDAEMNIRFLAWAGEILDASFIGSVTNTATSAITTALRLNSTNLVPSVAITPWDTSEKQMPIAPRATATVATAGLQTLTVYGSRNAGTAVWKAGGRVHGLVS